MNFFSIRTNDQNTIGQILLKEKHVVFNNLSWHKDEIEIDDFVFIVISGDNAKKEFDYVNGLCAIGKVYKLPVDDSDKNHFSLDVEVFEYLSKTLSKDDFYLYPTIKNAPNIGPETKNAPNQAFRKIENEVGKSIIKAISDLLNENFDKSKFESIVNNNFIIEKYGTTNEVENSSSKQPSLNNNDDFIQKKFVEWFERSENFKKSYDGLISLKILNSWNFNFFDNSLFTIDINNLKGSIIKIEKLINNAENFEWLKYSDATSKGAPAAILGKNNYLKFLEEFLNSVENRNDFIEHKFNKKQSSFNSNLFKELSDKSGLIFSNKLIQRFIASLCTKPFVICCGLSGSGKTKLAQAFVQWISETDEQFKVIPVGADWTNREPLLGYPNALQETKYVKPENGVLDFIILAQKNETKPYFLILDEMNLSHVERYFADFLSTMESGDAILLHTIENEESGIPKQLNLPKNFFIIGTVNIDETTYMFSPKVLDRANTIEFRLTESDLQTFIDSNIPLDMDVLKGKGAIMGENFVTMAKLKTDKNLKKVESELIDFFKELKKSGAEFGYRSASEIGRLMFMLDALGVKDVDLLDIAIMQKLLPKLHGSRNKLTKVLPTLGGFCLRNKENIKEDYLDKFAYNEITEEELNKDENIKYQISFGKICRMYKNAIENGFASYAEA